MLLWLVTALLLLLLSRLELRTARPERGSVQWCKSVDSLAMLHLLVWPSYLASQFLHL